MSCLTDRERVALEEIFLSLSINSSPFERYRGFFKTKNLLDFSLSRKQLKAYAQTKLYFRQKESKLRHRLKLLRRQ